MTKRKDQWGCDRGSSGSWPRAAGSVHSSNVHPLPHDGVCRAALQMGLLLERRQPHWVMRSQGGHEPVHWLGVKRAFYTSRKINSLVTNTLVLRTLAPCPPLNAAGRSSSRCRLRPPRNTVRVRACYSFRCLASQNGNQLGPADPMNLIWTTGSQSVHGAIALHTNEVRLDLTVRRGPSDLDRVRPRIEARGFRVEEWWSLPQRPSWPAIASTTGACPGSI
jgi:hypothetical protein